MRIPLLLALALAYLCGAAAAQAPYYPYPPGFAPPYANPGPVNYGGWYNDPAYTPAAMAAPAAPVSGPAPNVAPAVVAPPVAAPAVASGASHTKACWGSVQYAMGWFRPTKLPIPLVTIGSISDPTPAALGQLGTGVLFGDKITYDAFPGIQATAGLFLDDARTWSIDVRGLAFFPNTIRKRFDSDVNGNPLIARPFFDVAQQQESRAFDSFRGIVAGTATVESRSELWGFEVNGRCHTAEAGAFRADLLAGFRYLRLAEDLTIQDQFRPLVMGALTFRNASVNAPSSLADEDRFQTRNQFYGMQLGGRVSCDEGWFHASAYGNVGFGATEQRVTINGSTTLITPTGNQVATGGVLALPSNIGTYRRTVFAIVPEGGVDLGCSLSDYCRLSFGYSFLLWTQTVRPGGAIDRSINPSQIPSSPTFGQFPTLVGPEFRFVDESLWVHAFRCGLEFTY